MTIGEIIKTSRKSKKMTQETLASKSGLSIMSIRRYESDKRVPDFNTLKIIAEILEINPLIFLSEDDQQIAYDLYESETALDEYLESNGIYKIYCRKEDKDFIECYKKLNSAGKSKLFDRLNELKELGYIQSEPAEKDLAFDSIVSAMLQTIHNYSG